MISYGSIKLKKMIQQVCDLCFITDHYKISKILPLDADSVTNLFLSLLSEKSQRYLVYLEVTFDIRKILPFSLREEIVSHSHIHR